MTILELREQLNSAAMTQGEQLTLVNARHIVGDDISDKQLLAELCRANAYALGEYLANEYETYYAGIDGMKERQAQLDYFECHAFKSLDDNFTSVWLENNA